MKTTLTLVTGLPGVGKTTVAKILAEKTGSIALNSDVVRRELFPDRRDYSPQETGRVIQEVERRTKEHLQNEKSVILDALFTKRHQRDYYRKLALALGADFKLIHVVAPESLVEQRMNERQELENASEAGFPVHLDRKKHFEPEDNMITIANDDDVDSLKRKVDLLSRQR